jgi:hypothetical protein
MANSNVFIPPELSKQISEREKVWLDFDRSQNFAAELGGLSSAVPNCAPSELQLRFGSDSTPLNELETVLPMLKENIETAHKLKAEMQSCYGQIEAIKQQEKKIIMIGVIAGVVVLLVLIFVIVNLASGS